MVSIGEADFCRSAANAMGQFQPPNPLKSWHLHVSGDAAACNRERGKICCNLFSVLPRAG